MFRRKKQDDPTPTRVITVETIQVRPAAWQEEGEEVRRRGWVAELDQTSYRVSDTYYTDYRWAARPLARGATPEEAQANLEAKLAERDANAAHLTQDTIYITHKATVR